MWHPLYFIWHLVAPVAKGSIKTTYTMYVNYPLLQNTNSQYLSLHCIIFAPERQNLFYINVY